jgi:hypothetical protein
MLHSNQDYVFISMSYEYLEFLVTLLTDFFCSMIPNIHHLQISFVVNIDVHTKCKIVLILKHLEKVN